MPNISGHVYYNATNLIAPGLGIPNVPVVLYRPLDGAGITALTDGAGGFSFTNVPNGSYQLIEAWGAAGGTPSPVDFASAIFMPVVPAEAEPPLSALPVAPDPMADYLMAISPNLLNINVAGVDVTGLFFYDAPVGSKPITFNGVNFIGPNLITAADNGSFGSVPAGSPVNTIPAVAPYPTATPGLPYQAAPQITDGHYSIANIRSMTNPAWEWWSLSDHQTRLETGRFMFVNGDTPGAVLFEETISVSPNTFYVMTGWVMNLLKVAGVPPRFSFKVTASDGSQLGYQLLNSLGQTPVPVWYENGFLFNSNSYSSVKVQVLSEAPFSTTGNDYVIDEITMYEADIIDLLALTKSMTPSTIYSDTTGAGQDVLVTVDVTNTSAIALNNVVFQDTIDPQLAFVGGSVTVNGSGVGYGTADPNPGFSIGTLAPGATAQVQFHVTTLVPGPVVIPNMANAAYDAATSGNGDIIRHVVDSNQATVEIIINKATLVIDKSVDKLYANLGDIITYTLNITNTGNVPATNVVITDNVPAGTAYVPGSVTGATGIPPTLSLPAPIPAGGSTTVTFKVQVGLTLPSPNPVANIATATFNYTIDPAIPNGGSGTAGSNLVRTQVNAAVVTSDKTVDKAYANVNDILTYTITLQNTGNVQADNVVITDVLPNGTTFVPGSLSPNATGVPPTISLVAPILAGGAVVVTFQVQVDPTVPSPNPILNAAAIGFNYTVDPAFLDAAVGASATPIVSTTVRTATLTIVDSVDKANAAFGDTLTYTMVVTNTGNTVANNVVLTAPVPSGTSFVPGSVTGATGTPPTLALLAPLAPGASTTVTYQVTVDNAMPPVNPIPFASTAVFNYTVDPAFPDAQTGNAVGNPVYTQINQAIVAVVKSVDLVNAVYGDVITYTLTLTNTGNVPADNVVITDPTPSGTTFVPGSLSPNATGVPPTITLVASIPAGGTAIVTYKVKVGNRIPNPNPIPNTANVAFKFTVDPLNPGTGSGTATSETVTTFVAAPYIVATKAVDKDIAYMGEDVLYTITLENTGTLPANLVTVTDMIPTGLTYVPGSITSTSPVSGDPTTQILVTAPIPVGGIVVITFKATVTSIPAMREAINIATVKYSFTKDPTNPDGVTVTTMTNSVKTCLHMFNLMRPALDLVESIALEQTALSHILNAEGEKIQAALAIPNVTADQLLAINKSVTDTIKAITDLEAILQSKAGIVREQVVC